MTGLPRVCERPRILENFYLIFVHLRVWTRIQKSTAASLAAQIPELSKDATPHQNIYCATTPYLEQSSHCYTYKSALRYGLSKVLRHYLSAAKGRYWFAILD